MSTAARALSPGRRLGRAELTHLAMVLSIGMMSLPTVASSFTATSPAPAPAAPTSADVTQAYGRLPIRFEANHGQSDPAVKFLVRSGGATVFLTAREAVWTLPAADADGATRSVVRMSLMGGNPNPGVIGTGALPGVSNYFIGDDPATWHTNVPSYSAVRYQGVYPGIDQVYHAGGGGMEYDFDVAPGADPGVIAIAVVAAARPVIDARGDLVVTTGAGEMRQHRPSLYQQVSGERRPVEGHFAVRPDGTIGFAVGGYDHGRPLVIDPYLSYSTYLGGTNGTGGDKAYGIALDSSNNAYVTGYTTATNFPVTSGAYQTTCSTCNTHRDGFITKLNPTGSALVYSTYLGGTTGDAGVQGGVTVDASGNAYMAGSTHATDFPTPNGYKSVCGTTTTPCGTSKLGDAVLAKLGPTGGNLLYGTYVGGSGTEIGSSVALGAAGIAYVTGYTDSTDLVTSNVGGATPYQSTSGGGTHIFLVKVNTGVAGAGSLLYATYLGGGGGEIANAVAVDPATPDVAYLAGYTTSTNFPTTSGALQTALGAQATQAGFLSKLDTTRGTSGLLYSTYVGGTDGSTAFNGMAVKGAVAYLGGSSSSTSGYPVNGTNPAYQTTPSRAVITDIDTTKSGTSALVYSTYLGGGSININGLAVDAAGKITLTGSGQNFPLVNQVQGFDSSGSAVLVAQLDPTAGTNGLLYSTALGSSNDFGNAVAVDSATPSSAFVAGQTRNTTFPTTAGAFQTGAPEPQGFGTGFVAKLAPGKQTVVSGLSVHGGPFTGGTPVVITGSNFTGATAVNFGTVTVPATGFTVNSDTQITVTSPCVAPSNGTCPDSALGTASADTVNVTVTSVSTSFGPGAQFVYGEGSSAPSAPCPACGGAAVTLPNGQILDTLTTSDTYGDGTTVAGLNVFTSGTAISHQRTFTAADVGKRLSGYVLATSIPLFPPGTTITNVTGPNTVTVSNNAAAASTMSSFAVSNNVTTLYSPATDTWAPTGPCNACGEAGSSPGGLTLTLLNTGKVLAAGGLDPVGIFTVSGEAAALADAFLYDPAMGAWSSTGSLTTARKGATATLLATGKVLVAGGDRNGAPSSANVDPYASAELYDPGLGRFASTGSMAIARANAAAVALAGGNVLVAGGFITSTGTGPATATATAEQYNPGTGTWSSAGSMNTARWEHTFTSLAASGACGANCGKVLVANGLSCYSSCAGGAQNALTSAELYTPGSPGSWAYTGAPSQYRKDGEAALLANGKVLIANGGPNVSELYDPAAGTWKSAGLSVGDSDCCAVVMPPGPASVCGTNCGKVFFAGSAGTPGYYTPRPVVSGISPAGGAGMGGTTVTITGTGLASVAQVHFGSDMSATVLATPDPTTPDTKLTAVTPGELGSGATGSTVDTTVTSSGGVSSISAADQFTYGTFGSLQVTTSPSLPTQITVDGVPRDTTALNNLKMDAAPGSHAVCFREVPGYLPVPCQTVTVTAGVATSVQGVFVQKGTLKVTTNVSGGSVQVGPASHPTGSNVTNRDDSSITTDLAVGSYDVCFGKILNQKPPGCQTVNVTAGATTSVTGTYTSSLGALGDDPTLGSLKVSTSPAALGTQITVDNTPRNTDAIKNLKIPAGSHTVCVREVTGYLLPACQTVSVIATQNTSVTVTFVAKGYLTVTETPSGVGGTIFVNGTPRDDGGMSTDLPVGTSQVCFGAVSGHVTPACRSITITGGQTVSTTGAY